MFEDEQFFVCEKNCAVFVALDSLSESHNTSIFKSLTTSSADNGSTDSSPIDNLVKTCPSSGKSYIDNSIALHSRSNCIYKRNKNQ